ncbi:ParB/RepB/Spo0J family partition protein [Pseudovibrio sp. Ad37]|uniref:ParB/RepB/Spo0J family partition protein n=1 Tax=Pseudovibrio sp. Ad37 TaxID=989422 RepID=UPI0007B25EC2|nr:ParB/RepB/Spo0J family partition protein [Pseudovibrio sp. Ad37]KZL22700.1 Chromosome-partitioning protein Spo0J [Pseudovibrio sp. Ad37]
MKQGGSLARLGQLADRQTKDRILLLPVLDVEPNPNQVRKEFRDIDQLADSIQQTGLQQPILVSDKKQNGKYTIINGERRWRAHVALKKETIKAIVGSAPGEAKRIEMELVENIQRDNLTAQEIGSSLAKLVSLGFNHREIAKIIGKSRMYVMRHLKLNEDPSLVKQFADRGVSDADILSNLVKIHAVSPTSTEQLLQSVGTDALKREHVRDTLQKVTAKKAKKKPSIVGKGKSRKQSSRGERPQVHVTVAYDEANYNAILDLEQLSCRDGFVRVRRDSTKDSFEVPCECIAVVGVFDQANGI